MLFVTFTVIESKLLKARMRMQQKYVDQFYMLYDDFHITKLPLLPQEVYIDCLTSATWVLVSECPKEWIFRLSRFFFICYNCDWPFILTGLWSWSVESIVMQFFITISTIH